MKQTILVTGGMGYIGSHTAVELIAAGYNVIIVDNLSNSHAEVLDAIKAITGVRPTFFEFDLCDKSIVAEFFLKNQFDAVIHFAAFKAVGDSVENPLKYYHNNLVSLINLLQAKENLNMVFSSSCSVYGDTKALPVTEDTPYAKAESPYGNTKQISEEILRDCCKVNKNLQVTALRYFNPAGAHASALIGEYPIETPNNLVPVITQTAIGKRKEMVIYGNDYDTPDGTCIRDYIHVVDIAKAHVVAVKHLINKKNKENYEVYNLGTGRGNSVLEAIKAFEKVGGVKLNYRIGARREGDVVKVYADTSKANKELGWKAALTLDDIMGSAWAWEKALRKKQTIDY